jgi:HEPN domain-containing protein
VNIRFKTVVRLGAESEFRDIVGFHVQQAAEKYLKALLTRHQIEFQKTHVIRRLLILLEPVDPAMVEALDDANWLSPFGAEIRYPGDRAEALPDEEVRARQLAQKVRDAVMAVLDPYLAGG